MSEIETYLERVRAILRDAETSQAAVMEKAAGVLAAAIAEKHSIWTFGTGHAGILAMELYYRTGGLALINYLPAPGLVMDVMPPTLTTDMERLAGYGKALIAAHPVKAGDVMILHSVSGRNAVPVDAALYAKEAGACTICLTNLKTSASVPSRHESGKRLYQVCDLVIDNCGAYGDAELEIQGFSGRVAPTSTAVGAALLNAVVARTVALLVEKNIVPPVFVSSNVPGGDEHNAKIMREHGGQIHYM
ncbi:MAG: SIS domain-containing protein [Treponema sp.]|jgi:uncharacterized phosphosugar-binding protein|nr:SIS domain-containing protein [Treponema sp.]